jgi:hypothetical protein
MEAPLTWEDRLSELADYRKTTGHCNVPKATAKTPKHYVIQRKITSCSKKERNRL